MRTFPKFDPWAAIGKSAPTPATSATAATLPQTVAIVAIVAGVHPETAKPQNHLFIDADGGAWFDERLRDVYDERAAIMQFEGGMTRDKANRTAWADVLRGEGIIIND